MKRMKKYLILAVVTLSMCCFALPGWTQPQPGDEPQPPMAPDAEMPGIPGFQRGGEPGGDDIRINWKTLELTPEQQAQIEQKRREFQISAAGLREQVRFAEQDLREELQKDPVDRAKIETLLQNLSALKQQLSEAATQNLLAMRSLLTEAQLEKLANLQAPLPRELRGVDLTPEQRSQIQAIMKNSLRQNRQTTEELRDLKMELRETLLTSQSVDTEKLKQIQAAIAEKESALEKGRIEMLLQIKEVLMPEQREQVQQGRNRFPQLRERLEKKLPERRKNK